MRLSRRAKRRLAVLLAVTVLAGGGLVSWRFVRRAQARRLTVEARVEGFAAFRGGDYKTSLSRLGYYLRRHGSDLEALLAYADSHSKVPGKGTRHLVESARFYAEVLRVAPENQDALDRLLELYPRLGWRTEWMTIADRILVLDPNHVEALAAKVSGLQVGGDPDGALSHALRLVEIEPDNVRWRKSILGIRLAQNDPDDQLIDLCDEWIGDDTGDGRLHLVKASLLASLGRIEPARTAARLAVERGLDEPDLFRSLIDMLERLELEADVEAAIADARHRHPEAQWVIECAVARLWRLQRYEEALRVVLETERTVPAMSRELLRRKALVQMAMGSDKAAATLNALKQRAQDQDTEQQVVDEAWSEAMLVSLDERSSRAAALQAFEFAIALQPRDPVLHYLVGQENARSMEHELAVVSFERAARLGPNWVVPQLALGRSLLAMGRATVALDVARGLIRRFPNAGLDPWVLFATAWLAEAPGFDEAGLTDPGTGQPIDLVRLLRSLHERSGRDPTIGVLLVRAYLRVDRRQDAVDLIEQAMSQATIAPTHLLHLSRISDEAGLGLGRRLIDRARALAGLTLEIAEAEARLLEREGRLDEGLALLDQAIPSATAPPGLPVKAMLRAEYLARAGRIEAVGALQDLLEDHASSTAVVNFVLRQQLAWDNEPLVSQAIDRLEAMLGEGSPRVLLARASLLLRFRPQDDAATAQAMILLSDVLRRVPDSVAALVIMSKILRDGDDFDVGLAIRYLRRAVELRPDRLDLYPQLITLLQQQGHRDAEEYLRRLGGRADVPLDLRRVEIGLLTDQGDFETAATRLGGIVDESAPESAQLALASLHRRAGDYAAAESIYVRLLASPDRSAAVIEAAAGFYATMGRRDEAFTLLNAAELRDTPGFRAMLLGRLYQKHGDLDEATRWLKEAVAAAPDKVEAWIELVRHWLLLGDAEEALRVATSGLELHPDNAALRVTLSMAGVKTAADLMGNLGADNEAVQATVALYAQADDETGTLVPRERDLADSRGLLTKFPLFRPAWHLAVLMHTAAGRADEAIRIARQAANRFRGAAEPPQWAVQLLVEQGRSDEALEMAHAWRRLSLEDPLAADTVIASVLVDLSRPADAVLQLAPHADRILAAPDRLSDNLAVWVGALLHDRRFEEATAIATPLMSEDDLWPAKWLALAATADVDITRRAIELTESYLDPTPSGALALANSWLRLARRSGETSDSQRAEELALTAGEEAGWEIPSLHILASLATLRDDPETTESHYQRILALDPQDLVALNNLAFALVQNEGRCEEAAGLSARALALRPGNPHILDTHAQALACRGDLDEAESAARLAVSSGPDDPAMVLTLVRILMARSKLTAAEIELDRAEGILRRTGRVGDSTWTEVEALRDRLREQRSLPVR